MTAGALAPGDAGWNSYVEPALRIEQADAVEWYDSADVVVVGFGGAGVCAALEAKSRGVDVLAIDRFSGGGATAVSGGVCYAGGTKVQKEAGIEDSAEELYKYLKVETQGVVKDETLRKFCSESSGNLDWLASHGVRFGGPVYEKKTVYPPEGYYLYYSGNEQLSSYAAVAKPAPRGHRTIGKGIFCGAYLFAALRESAQRAGVRLLPHSPVVRLVHDRAGAVVGVEVNHLPPDSAAFRKHEKGYRRFQSFLRFSTSKGAAAIKQFEALEKSAGQRKLIRARRGVILSTGSFAFNRDMVRHYVPGYGGAMPAASAGCDGSGMRLGQTSGGALGQMHVVSAWRWISPPLSFLDGIIVDKSGRRFVEEDSYSGRLGEKIGEHRDHTAYLVIDRRSYINAWKEVSPLSSRFLFEGVPILRTLMLNCRKGKTLKDVAAHYNLPADTLERTAEEYNAGARRGVDSIGKTKTYLRALGPGPYYIVDISTGNPITICSGIPMGGLRVNETTGNVIRADGSDIPGLYAAGRNAVGIPSHFYVSGTSIADCVFAGRRAGANAAAATRTGNSTTPAVARVSAASS
jgi:3-oxo-5alpha-steroid 4-dehydrogenase